MMKEWMFLHRKVMYLIILMMNLKENGLKILMFKEL